MTVGSLFSGIGGLDLGFERAGFEIKWMCEAAEYPRKVLAKNWPTVPIYDDVRTVSRYNAEPVDCIIGGFPCQDISFAGEGAGLAGERSGLWWEMHRVIGDLGPRYVVVENVAALVVRGLDAVLGSLSDLGYDAEWQAIPAAAFGALHHRERMFIIAHAVRSGFQVRGKAREDTAHAPIFTPWPGPAERITNEELERRGASMFSGEVHGIPRRMDRIKALGNAVYPQVAEHVASCVRAHAEASGLWTMRRAA